jgi:hypothetical protein
VTIAGIIYGVFITLIALRLCILFRVIKITIL